MSHPERFAEVGLPAGTSASALLHRLLEDAARAFPEALAAAELPVDAGGFRSGFPEALARFEAARVGSPQRFEIARFLTAGSAQALRLPIGGDDHSLADAMRRPAPPERLEVRSLAGSGRLVPRVPWRGAELRGRELLRLAEELHSSDHISSAARAALEWLVGEGVDASGEIDLGGRRFAILGAAAELAPTPLLLAAGAEVLWIDRVAPPDALAKDSELSGRLHVPEREGDLLRRPRELAASIARFAERGPLDLGLYAYAGGRGQEWRLEAAMNAIARALDPAAVRSLALLVSPTSPAVVSADELETMERRRAARPAWQSALDRLGLLGAGPAVERSGVRVRRSVLAVQGASYQAAQYLEKILAAEVFALGEPGRSAWTVSANVAAVTRTRSLRHPVFEAAFAGARAFAVETYPPETTRWLNGLLLLHDLLNPAAACSASSSRPATERARALGSQRVHGGLYALPYALEPTVRVGALLGIARRPGLALGLLRRGGAG